MPGVATSHIWAGAKLGVADLLARSRTKLLVFRYPPEVAAPLAQPCQGGYQWIPANASNVESLFSADPERCELFLQFLNNRCAGLFLVRHGTWLCHGWYSEPGSALPTHLPSACRRRGGYWVFFCRVRQGFRGQGYYRSLLLKMVSSIRACDPLAQVDIDTEPDNFPSRHAIQACGFLPRGIIVRYKLGIPSKWRMVVGQWYSDRPHPGTHGDYNERAEQQKTKQAMAKQLHTSRSQLDRRLGPRHVSVTLDTITRAARAFGKRVIIRVADAKARRV